MLPSLLEREDQLRAVQRLLEDLEAGRGGSLTVLAAAGLGKTRLIEAADERARARGIRVLSQRGSRLRQEDAWGLARRLVAPILDGAERPVPLAVEDTARTLLDMAEGLTELVIAAAADRPLLVCVDDAQWAGHASLRLLDHLVEQTAGHAVGVLIAARPEGTDEARGLVEQIAARTSTRVVRLPALSSAAAQALVRSALEAVPADARTVVAAEAAQLTAGNPQLLGLLVDAVQGELAAGRPVAGRMGVLGRSAVRELVGARLTEAGAVATAVARAVALLGDEATVRRVAGIGDVSLREVEEAADDLARVGLLESTEPLRFVQPIVGTAVYDAIPAAAVSEAHGRAATMLIDDGVPAMTIAAHLVRAPRCAHPDTVDRLAAAADRALRSGDAPTAVSLLERALEEPPRAGERAELLFSLGRARAATGEATAGAAFGEALELLADDPTRCAEVRREEGRWLFATGRAREAARAYLRARAELTRVDPGHPLDQELRAAYLGVAHFDVELRPLVNRELQELLDEDSEGHSPAERALLAQLAYQQTLAAAPRDRVRALCERAWSAGALLADEGAHGDTWKLVAGARYWIGDLEQALVVVSAAAEKAELSGLPFARATTAWCGGPPKLHRGDVDGALASARVALDARRLGWALHLGSLHRLHARCLIERGELSAAAETLDEALGLESLRHSMEVPVLHEARGRVRLLRGDAAGALADFEAAGEGARDGTFAQLPSVLPWRSSAALALRELGEKDRALDLLDDEEALAERAGVDRCLSTVLRVRGLVVGGEEGIEHLAAAVAVMDGPEPRLERTYAQLDLGAALRRANRRPEAEPLLRRAQAAAQAGGATVLAERARTELAALGARARAPGRFDRDLLTSSERRVARLAADGRTNKEIASALFVTTKTVEFHLGQVFRKLDVRRRTELGRVLGRTEHDPSDI